MFYFFSFVNSSFFVVAFYLCCRIKEATFAVHQMRSMFEQLIPASPKKVFSCDATCKIEEGFFASFSVFDSIMIRRFKMNVKSPWPVLDSSITQINIDLNSYNVCWNTSVSDSMGEISGRPNSNTSLLVHSWKLFQLGAIPVCKMIRYSQSQKVGITATTLWLGFPYYPRLYLFLSLLCLLSGITPVGFAVSSVVSEGRFKLMCFVFFFLIERSLMTLLGLQPLISYILYV